MRFGKINAAMILLSYLLSSCASPPDPRVYTLPDLSAAESDAVERQGKYEEGKLAYGPLPGTFGPDVFLQKSFIEKADYSVKLALNSDVFEIPKDRFSDDCVLVGNLFRLDDAALAAYSGGRKSEERKQAVSAVAALGGALVLFAAASFMMDRAFAFIGELVAPERNNEPAESNQKLFAGMGIGGAVLGIGGLVFRGRYERSRRASYREAADLYNAYLRSVYDLE